MAETLIDLPKHSSAEIVNLEGGKRFRTRLEAMGIRIGKTVSIVSSQALGGPVIISVDGRHTAIGRGMASRIKVEANNEKS